MLLKNTLKLLFEIGLGVLGTLGVLAVLGKLGGQGEPAPTIITDTLRITITDTIRYFKPVARDSTIIRYETVKLPIPADTTAATAPPDTTTIRIPITRKVYEDSTYRAIVSGYRAQLDTIQVYPHREIITIKSPAPKPRRWNISLQGGYGITPKGMQPYLGIGISWRLSF